MVDWKTTVPEIENHWIVNCQLHDPPVTLRQWFELLAGIFGEETCTPFDQMELLHCLKEQGFEI